MRTPRVRDRIRRLVPRLAHRCWHPAVYPVALRARNASSERRLGLVRLAVGDRFVCFEDDVEDVTRVLGREHGRVTIHEATHEVPNARLDDADLLGWRRRMEIVYPALETERAV